MGRELNRYFDARLGRPSKMRAGKRPAANEMNFMKTFVTRQFKTAMPLPDVKDLPEQPIEMPGLRALKNHLGDGAAELVNEKYGPLTFVGAGTDGMACTSPKFPGKVIKITTQFHEYTALQQLVRHRCPAAVKVYKYEEIQAPTQTSPYVFRVGLAVLEKVQRLGPEEEFRVESHPIIKALAKYGVRRLPQPDASDPLGLKLYNLVAQLERCGINPAEVSAVSNIGKRKDGSYVLLDLGFSKKPFKRLTSDS
jgi:hypothetical protein